MSLCRTWAGRGSHVSHIPSVTPRWPWLQIPGVSGQGAPSLFCSALLGQPLPVLLRSPVPRGQLSGRGEGVSSVLTCPPPPPSLHFLPGESKVLLLASCGPCGPRFHCMEPFLSKSYLIPLLRRLWRWGWRAARVVEACKPAVGKLSSIKANRWPIQACQGPCQGTSGAGGMGDRQLPSEASSLALRPAQDPERRGEGEPCNQLPTDWPLH